MVFLMVAKALLGGCCGIMSGCQGVAKLLQWYLGWLLRGLIGCLLGGRHGVWGDCCIAGLM